ncbi:hypothetical protein [Mucilaginibacter arboris]|nr:hypothetical protein [Mucilaginibacter arboris]
MAQISQIFSYFNIYTVAIELLLKFGHGEELEFKTRQPKPKLN